MKFYLILLSIFILALFQGAFLPLNLVLLVVLIYSVFNPEKESLWIAFFSGLILDLAKGTPLGFSSLLSLIFSFGLILYGRRFNPFSLLPIIVFLFSIIYTLILNYLISKTLLFDWQRGLWLAALALATALVLRHFWGEKGIIKLKTS